MELFTDEQLVQQVLTHADTAAFDQLVKRYQRRVYGICFSIVCDWSQANDLAQEAFLRAWLDLAKLREPSRFAPWICRIAFGACTDWLRKFQPQRHRQIPDISDAQAPFAPHVSPLRSLEHAE